MALDHRASRDFPSQGSAEWVVGVAPLPGTSFTVVTFRRRPTPGSRGPPRRRVPRHPGSQDPTTPDQLLLDLLF